MHSTHTTTERLRGSLSQTTSNTSSSAAYPSPPSQQTAQQHPSLPSSTSSYLSQNLNNNKYPQSPRHAPSHAPSVHTPPLNLSFLGPNAVFYQPQNFAAFCYSCKTTLLTKLKSGALLRTSPEARLAENLCENCRANWSEIEHSTRMSTSIYTVNRLSPAASLPSSKPRVQPNLLHDVFFSAAPKIESFDSLDVSTPLSNLDPPSPACFSSAATAANSPSIALSPSPSCSSLSSASYGNLEGGCKVKVVNTVGLGMDGASFGIDEFSSTVSSPSASPPPKSQISPPLSPNVYLFDDSETLFGLDFADACRVDAFSIDANATAHDHYLAAVAAAGELLGSRPSKSHSESGFLPSDPYGWLENTYPSEEPLNYFQDAQSAYVFSAPPTFASSGPYVPFNTHGAAERHRMSSPQIFAPYGGNSVTDRQAPSMPSPYSSSFPSNPTTVSLDAISPRVDTGCFGVPTSWNDGTLVDHTKNAKRKPNMQGKDQQEIYARTSSQGQRRTTLDYQTARPFSRRMTEVSDALITLRKSSSLPNMDLLPTESGRRGSHIRKRRCSGLEMATSVDYSEEDELEDGMYGQGDSADETYVTSRHLVGIIDTDAEEDPVGSLDDSEVESEPEHVRSAESLESSDISEGETADEEEKEVLVDKLTKRRDRVAVHAPHVKRTVVSGTTGIVPTRTASTVTSARRKSRIALGKEIEPSSISDKQSLLYKFNTIDKSSLVDDREPSPIPSTPVALVAAREAGGGDLNSPRDTLRPTVFESLTAGQVDWCRYCGTTEGVNWRPGPWGKRTLCNKHGCDYKGYGFACKLPRLDLTAYVREKIDERERPVLQLFCTTCHDPDSYVSNTLVRCEGCPRAYHRLCYDGLCTLPDLSRNFGRQWFCSESCSDNARRRRIVVELPRRKLPLMSTPKASDVTNLGMGSKNNRNGKRQ